MIKSREPDHPTERDLAELADGSLAPTRRAHVERAVAASPELQRNLHDQQIALAAVCAASAALAPVALRARVALARPGRRPVRRFGALAVAATAGIAATIVLTLGDDATESPSVADAAVLATRPPAAPVPRATYDAATLPGPHGAGLRFPAWQGPFGWKAVGLRHDRLGGHPATTVFYRRGVATVAYTIVGGRALPASLPTQLSVRDGTTLRSLTVHGRPAVTWLRRGHTCVLSGTGTTSAALLRLAAWRGGGQIQY